MIYVILILLIIVSVLLALTISYLTIDIHLKNQLLLISVGNRLYRKKFEIDFLKREPAPSKNDDKSSEKQESPFGLTTIKDRIYSAENGFNFDEIKNIKGGKIRG